MAAALPLGGKLVQFSKYRHSNYGQNDVPFEKIHQIARLRVVEGMKPVDIAKETGVKYTLVCKIIESKYQESAWLDAISNLGRSGETDLELKEVKRESASCPQCILFSDTCTHLKSD